MKSFCWTTISWIVLFVCLSITDCKGKLRANPPCYSSCYRAVVPYVKKEVVYRDRLKVLQVPFVVVPTYSATFLPPPPVVIQQGSTAVVPQSVNYTSQQSAYGFAAGAAVQAQAVGVQAAGVQQAQQLQGTSVTADALAVALERINQRLCALEGNGNGNGTGVNNGNPVPGQPPGRPLNEGPPFSKGNAAKLLQPGGYPQAWNGCAVCHTAGKLKGERNTFVMFDGPGKLTKLNDRQTKNILLKVGIGAMPPKDNKEGVPPLTQKDVDETFDYAASLK